MNEYLHKPLLLVIFGISGNLAHLKLVPALYHLLLRGELPEKCQIIGISRQDYSVDDLLNDVRKNLAGEQIDEAVFAELRKRITINKMDLSSTRDYTQLKEELNAVSASLGSETIRMYYLSIPAQAFSQIVTLLGETGHNEPFANEITQPRILVEKPFGYDVASAKALIDSTEKHFSEPQVYRIDHYLAKETAQNVLTFRFKNSLFSSIWNAKYIDEIRVSAFESIGIEGRSSFYEQTGALRDILQSHLLQLFALIAMEQPARLESGDIHRAKLRLLESIHPIEKHEVSEYATRGQYETYRKEVENPESLVETFARLQLEVDNEQWRGTKVIIETGKSMSEKLTQIAVHFRDNHGNNSDNTLLFRVQPREGISLLLQAKQPGITNQTETVEMEFDYERSFQQASGEAYERVIIDALRGDQSLFASSQEVLASWRIVEHVLSEWQKPNSTMVRYEAGAFPDDL